MVDEEQMMPKQIGDFLALLKEGKIEEARTILETEKSKSKYAPDTINTVKGKPPRFTKKGKPVELGDDGKWCLKP
jgi:hypothetical protein